jgi:hypothetical protein
MMEGIGSGLAVVKVRWGDPFGRAVFGFSGCPALFRKLVVRSAPEC